MPVPLRVLKSFGIVDDDHLLTVVRYVEGNPVRAGLVETATDWLWSSHRERCGLEQEKILAPFPIDLTRGLAPQGACPRPEHDSAGACPHHSAWTVFVDTPLTARETAKIKRKIERQSGEEERLLH